ncbi:MAG: TetR/AcrR family transcriptional regulator [Anaerolineae bacterium]
MQLRAEETREHILKASLYCFAHQGYDGTSVADICAFANISKGALYHHFSSKQAVFLELLNDWLADLDAGLATVDQTEVPAGVKIAHMAELTGSIFQQTAGQLPLFLQFWVKAAQDPVVWESTIHHYHRYVTYFTKLYNQGIADGSLHPEDARLAAQGTVGLAIGILLQALLDPQGADWSLVMRRSMIQCLRSYGGIE